MALGAKLIAATLILGASTVGTYAIANGGLGGLSSEGDSSTSSAENSSDTQKAVQEAPTSEEGSTGTRETGVRAGSESSVDVVPQDQPQPAQASVPETKEGGTVLDNPVAKAKEREEQAERVEGAGDTAVTLPGTPRETPPSGDPAPAELPNKGTEETGPKGDAKDQVPEVRSNVEAEVAPNAGHSSEGVTPQQPAAGGQGDNLGDTSHTAVPASDEIQNTNTNADGGDQSNPVTKQDGDNDDPSKGNQAEVAQAPGNTGATGGKDGTRQQDKGALSDHLDVTQIEAGDSHTPSNQTNNGQKGATLETQDGQNTEGN